MIIHMVILSQLDYPTSLFDPPEPDHGPHSYWTKNTVDTLKKSSTGAGASSLGFSFSFHTLFFIFDIVFIVKYK